MAYQLQVEEIISETEDTVTVGLQVPDDLEPYFKYRPGQYLTLEHVLEGVKLTSAYSISSAPHEGKLSITVKNTEPEGLSRHILENLKVGDMLSVDPPKGKFTPKLDPDRRHSYYMIAAGSGIAPLYSMIKSILEEEPLSTVYLLYGNRSYEEIIYRDALLLLAENYTDQFFVRFQLSRNGPRPVLHQNKTTGRINRKVLLNFLADYPKQTAAESFFICGPAEMVIQTELILLESGIDKNNIFAERFNADPVDHGSKEIATDMTKTSRAHITLDGNEIDIEIAEQSILQTLIDAGYDPPFSCTSGVCTTCMAKLTKGSVEMDENYGLDESEVADGFILTCQSHPTSDEIELTYDV